MNVLSMCDERLKHLLVTNLEPGSNIHNNELNNNAATNPLICKGVVNFIQDQENLHGESYATRIVRVLTKYELHDEENGAVDLPSSFTKRSMYESYCYENGWEIKADNRGLYPHVTEYAKSNLDDILWQDAMEMTEVVGWTSFRSICKESCSKIRICAPCNDTCGVCSIFRNALRYRQSCQKSTNDIDPDINSDINSDSNSEDNDDFDIKAVEDNSSALANSFLSGEDYSTEVIIEAAGHHLTQSKSMRGLIQFKTKMAIESVLDECHHIDRDRVIVCDFGQNLPFWR
jgi:hypothetical protein